MALMKAAHSGVSSPQIRALAVIPKGNCSSALAAVETFKVINNSEISKLELGNVETFCSLGAIILKQEEIIFK